MLVLLLNQRILCRVCTAAVMRQCGDDERMVTRRIWWLGGRSGGGGGVDVGRLLAGGGGRCGGFGVGCGGVVDPVDR
ncbi:hypothetical protein Tco_0149439 [Tanacetum coccineum]